MNQENITNPHEESTQADFEASDRNDQYMEGVGSGCMGCFTMLIMTTVCSFGGGGVGVYLCEWLYEDQPTETCGLWGAFLGAFVGFILTLLYWSRVVDRHCSDPKK